MGSALLDADFSAEFRRHAALDRGQLFRGQTSGKQNTNQYSFVHIYSTPKA